MSSVSRPKEIEGEAPWIGLTSEREGGSGRLWLAADSVFGIFESRRRRRTSQSAARNVHGGRQWRAIAYISLASRCSRLLITQGSGLGTRVINGSRPRLGYRGTKLRANLPQPYINPDFLRLLSQRSPSLPPSLPAAGPMPMPDSYGTVQWKGMRLILSRFIPPFAVAPRLKLCIKKQHTRTYGNTHVICFFLRRKPLIDATISFLLVETINAFLINIRIIK